MSTPETDPGAEAPFPNRQAGVALDPPDPAEAGVVATGDRREAVHFQADKDQLVVARYLHRPHGPLAAQMTSSGAPAEPDSPPVEDVAVAAEDSSVWDARPADEGDDI
jgi:hypothetical protein